MDRSRLLAVALGLATAMAPRAWAQVTQRMSVNSTGREGNLGGLLTYPSIPAMSADGRYVAFQSRSDNLVPGDTNGTWDIFVRDRQSGTTERVNVDSGGVQGDATSNYSSISADGRYVAFTSSASNLVQIGRAHV